MNENKKDLMIGMLYALAGHFKYEFSTEQKQTFIEITGIIDEIYYEKRDVSKPTSRMPTDY